MNQPEKLSEVPVTQEEEFYNLLVQLANENESLVRDVLYDGRTTDSMIDKFELMALREKVKVQACYHWGGTDFPLFTQAAIATTKASHDFDRLRVLWRQLCSGKDSPRIVAMEMRKRARADV